MSIRRLVMWLSLALAACGKPKAENTDKPAPAAAQPPGSAARPAPAAPAVPASSDGYDAGALGALRFEVSGGTPEAKREFTRGLLALHSFWYDEATRRFQAAIDADSTFAMAYWGLAMSHAKLLWADDNVAAGQDALRRMPAPETLPPHDQAWVVAAVALYRAGDVRTSRKQFLDVMEQLNDKFPVGAVPRARAALELPARRPARGRDPQARRRTGGSRVPAQSQTSRCGALHDSCV